MIPYPMNLGHQRPGTYGMWMHAKTIVQVGWLIVTEITYPSCKGLLTTSRGAGRHELLCLQSFIY